MRYMHKQGRPDLHNPKPLDDRWTTVSDLWFNHDHSGYTKRSKDGMFDGYDIPAMLVEAEDFASAIKRLTGFAPSAIELVEDFHARL